MTLIVAVRYVLVGSPGGPGIHVGVSEQFLWCRSRYCHAGGGGSVIGAGVMGGVLCLQWCLGRWLVSIDIHMNARIWGSPAEC